MQRTHFRRPVRHKCWTFTKTLKKQIKRLYCSKRKPIRIKRSSVVFLSSVMISVCSACMCVSGCVCSWTFVSCAEEQKVSAGLVCVGGFWDLPWKQPKTQRHFLSWSSQHIVWVYHHAWCMIFVCLPMFKAIFVTESLVSSKKCFCSACVLKCSQLLKVCLSTSGTTFLMLAQEEKCPVFASASYEGICVSLQKSTYLSQLRWLLRPCRRFDNKPSHGELDCILRSDRQWLLKHSAPQPEL